MAFAVGTYDTPGRGGGAKLVGMNPRRFLALLVAVVFLAVVVQPARAEALEPTTILLIVGAGVAVVLVLAVVIIANIRDYQRGESALLLARMVPPEAP